MFSKGLKFLSKALQDLAQEDAEDLFLGSPSSSHNGHLVRLEEALIEAMSTERYEVAKQIREEMRLLLQPSQRAQRQLEFRHERDMQEMLEMAVPRSSFMHSISKLTQQAVQGWRSISGNERSLVSSPTKGERGEGQPAEGHSETGLDAAEKQQQQQEKESKARQSEVGLTVESLHVALSSGDLANAVGCSMRLIEMVGEGDGEGLQHEEESEEVSMEMADACFEKVCGAVSARLVAIPEESARSKDWGTGREQVLALLEAVVIVGKEDEAAACLVACVVGDLEAEGVRRCDKIEGSLRLAKTMYEGARLNKDDPIFVVSLRELLNKAASCLQSGKVFGSKHLGKIVTAGNDAAFQGCTRVLELFSVDRDVEGRARAARKRGDDSIPQQQDAIALDLLMDELTNLLSTLAGYDRFVDALLERPAGGSTNLSPDLEKYVQNLAMHYVVLEEVYLALSLRKAMSKNALNEDTNSSSIIEDGFFLMDKCSARSHSTSSLLAALPVGNIIIEQLCVYILDTLSSKGTEIDFSQEHIGSREAINLLQHLNNCHYSVMGTKRLCVVFQRSFEAQFAGGAKGAAEGILMELDDVLNSLKKLLDRGICAAVVAVSPDVAGPLERLLVKANYAAKAGAQVHPAATPTKDRHSKSNFFGDSETPCHHHDPLVARAFRAMHEIVAPLRPGCASVVFGQICFALLMDMASKIESIVLHMHFSEAGALCLQAQVTGLAEVFTEGDEDEEGNPSALLDLAQARSALARLRLVGELLGAHNPGEAKGVFEDYGCVGEKHLMSVDEVRAVLRIRIGGMSEADIMSFTIP